MPEANDKLIAQLRVQIDELRRHLVQANGHALAQRQAREILARSERRYRALVNNLPDIVYTLDAQGTLLSVNPAVETLLGWHPQQLVGRPIVACLAETDVARLPAAMRQCLAGACVLKIEARFRTASGEYRVLEVFGTRDEGDDEAVIIGSARDVTEREQTEQALRTQNYHLEQLLTTARSVTSTLNLEQVLQRIAGEARTMLQAVGCSIYHLEEDGRTLTPLAAVEPPFEAEIMATPLDVQHSFTGQAVLAGKGLIFNDAAADQRGANIPGTSDVPDEAVMTVPFAYDGQVRGAICLSRHGVPFSPADLTVVETLAVHAAMAIRNAGLYQDLSREKEASDQARQALARSESLYRALFEQANEAIFLEDEHLHIVDANARACQLLGYTRDELLAAALTDILPAGACPEPISKITRDLSKPFEGINVHHDGHEIPVEVTVSPVPGSGQHLAFAIVRDITERKQRLAEIHQRARQLEALHAVNIELTRQLDLDELVQSVSQRMSSLLGAELGGFYLYNAQRDLLDWVRDPGQQRIPGPPRGIAGEGLAGRVGAEQRPMWGGHYSDWGGRLEAITYKFESVLGVPVRWGDHAFGVLLVNSGEADAFGAPDAELLTLFAMQVAVALHNAHLFEDARAQSQLLTATLAASEPLHHGLDLADVLQRTADGMASLGYRRVAISLRSEQDGELVTCAISGIEGEEVEALLGARYPWHTIEALMAEQWRLSRSYLIHLPQRDWLEKVGGPVVFTPVEPRGPEFWSTDDSCAVATLR
jgi:PAS domain S-box-containing protein